MFNNQLNKQLTQISYLILIRYLSWYY